MRRDRFLEQYPRHVESMHKVAQRTVDFDTADEIVASCIANILRRKKYKQIPVNKLRSFLTMAVNWERGAWHKANVLHEATITRLPDADEIDGHIEVRIHFEEPPLIECPFCFRANLNQYGACAMCGTIVPSHYRNKQNVIRMDKESCAMDLDFNKQIDIAKAIARLTPKEQVVVKSLILGNETLDTLVNLTYYDRTHLWRTWILAKRKLQVYLQEYAI